MLLSLNWLKQYINLPKNLTPEKMAEDLTLATVEVESVKNLAESFENVIVGKIVKIKKHPNADKLKIALTDIGQKQLAKIVCGGTNLREGMLVVVALPGAKVKWHGQGEPMVLEKAKIRGEESFGMICSANEVGLDELFPCGAEEVVDLSGVKNIKAGQKLAQALGLDDVVIEIDNKSLTNRPDLWNHYGIARELSVIYKTKLKKLELKQPVADSRQPAGNLEIKIKDKKLCSRYIGCRVENVKVEKSPAWLAKRLEAVGLRVINNIVDITNYVMEDVGQPMHAFDAALLHTDKSGLTRIIIRPAKDNEKIITLDGEERKLAKPMLVIADEKEPIALAGIMGGAKTEISEKTQDIILEAATFNPVSIRKTAQKLGLRTEASIRFEKNLDPNFAEIGMLRALQLIKKICPSAKIKPLVDANFNKAKKITINVSQSLLEKKIGQKLDSKEVVSILEKLGFQVKIKNLFVPAQSGNSREKEASKRYLVEVPSWRATGDISIPEDIVEEIARIYNYNRLGKKVEMVELAKAKYQLEFELEQKIKNYLSIGCGMNEVFNYPWADGKILKELEISDKMIELDNPPSPENRFLEVSLIPNLIKNIKDNLRYFDEFKIFELARVFKPGKADFDGKDKLPLQPKMLAGAVVLTKSKDAFLEIKGIVNQIPNGNFPTSSERVFQFLVQDCGLNFINKNKYLAIKINGEKIGWLGELREKIRNKNIGLFEINFDRFARICQSIFVKNTKKYQPLPQYPSIERDIAIEVNWQVKWKDVYEFILNTVKEPIIKKINFLSEFDLGNKKSLAFRVIYQANRTLKDEEVEFVEKNIIKNLEKEFEAKLRG